MGLIGRGGMGEVYKAWDEELEDYVALKTLRLEVSSDVHFNSRFRREIQLARKVTHTNVCRIFDSFKHDLGSGTYLPVLSMELLHGQTLAEYLKQKSRLSESEAGTIAEQIIAGLSAVHSAGIVHRDLKPSNLILIPNGEGWQVKITDFGIAGRLPGDPSQVSLTQATSMLGTPDYMAPEQLEHGNSTIQSDIYALGLLLYEMVTGAKPFLEGAAWKRVSQEAPSPRKLITNLSSDWNKTILCCLEMKPEYRFPNTLAVLQCLRGEDKEPQIPRKPLRIRLQRAAKSRRVIVTTYGLFLLLALSWAIVRIYSWKPKLQEGAMVLFPEVENATSDQQLEAVTVLMRNQLEQSPKFVLLDRSQVNSGLQQMGKPVGAALSPETARELAWRNGTKLILFATISRAANGYSLNVRAEEAPVKPDVKSRFWEQSFTAENKEGIFDAVQRASFWFRELVEQLPVASAAAETPPQSTTTSSWSALLLFSQAEKVKAAGQTTQAIALLKQCVEIDPDFSLAYMRLGDLYISLKDEKDGFLNWRHALGALQRRPVTQKEELRIRGLFAQDSGDWKASEEALKTFEILYPHEYLPSFYLASTLTKLNRTEDALEETKEAQTKDSGAYAPVAQEARLELVLGRLEESKKAIARLHTMGRNDSADAIEVGLDLLNEDLAGAANALKRLQQASDPLFKSKSFSLRGAFLSELRRFPSAIQALREGITFDDANKLTFNEADKWLALAYLSLRTGDVEGCRAAALDALKKEKGRLHLLQAGTLLARAGFIADARRTLRQLDSWTSFPLLEEAKHQIQGEIFLAQHQPQEAVGEMRLAAQLDAPNSFREYLARAFELSGDIENARALYRHMAGSPAQIWQAPDYAYPGFWADMEETYVGLEPDWGNRVVRGAQARMKRLREFLSP